MAALDSQRGQTIVLSGCGLLGLFVKGSVPCISTFYSGHAFVKGVKPLFCPNIGLAMPNSVLNGARAVVGPHY